MIVFYLILTLFLSGSILSIYKTIGIYRLIKLENFRIEKKSPVIAYTTKELSQLYDQSSSETTNKKIDKLIKLTRAEKRIWIFLLGTFLAYALIAWLLNATLNNNH